MRLGVRLGPFYASTGSRRRRGNSGCGDFLGWLIAIGVAVSWPFALGQRHGGGYHDWVWAVAIPWWLLLAAGLLAYSGSKGGGPGSTARGGSVAARSAYASRAANSEEGRAPLARSVAGFAKFLVWAAVICAAFGWPLMAGWELRWPGWIWAVAISWWVVLLIGLLVFAGSRASQGARKDAENARRQAAASEWNR